jgi:osmoprotectant transport system permease protein
VDSRVGAALRLLPEYLGQHVLLSASALGLGLLTCLPLVFAASRSARVRWPVLAFASVVQTVPGIALLALFYPLLLAFSSIWERLFGYGFSALGFLPSLLALTLYSMLPILRNGATAIANLDPAVIEAARGVGMTGRQQLLRIELPLAAPVLMAGVRISAIWVIGTATLSTPVGQTSLGNFIFSGLQVENWVSVLVGCAAAVGLALVTDQLLALIEHGVGRRKPAVACSALGFLLAGVAVALVPAIGADEPAYVVGAKSFTEQYILSSLMEERIRKQWATLRERYWLHFRRRRQFQSTFMYRAVEADEVQVIAAFSSEGRIGAYDLVVLEDPLEAILPYDAVLLLAPARAADETLHRALAPLVGAIPIELMRDASLSVDDTGLSPRHAAQRLASSARLD